ncbi:MAG: GntR family transcriptional regulator [Armatimonadetes bacterium]|nr:GntR family transcriptional regulator [Armatimonadota bacterium]
MALLRESPVPLYLQLMELLQQRIERGELQLGDRLPTEEELARTYNISRVTVRTAISALVEKNLLVRRQGKGTFVAPPRIEQELDFLRNLHEMLEAKGLKASVELLRLDRAYAAPAAVAGPLQVAAAEPVIRITRRHLVGQQPAVFAVIYLAPWCGRFLTTEALRRTSAYTLIEGGGVTIALARQRISAVGADDEAAAALEIDRGNPVLLVENTGVTEDGRPVDYSQLFYNPAQVVLAATLRHTRAEPSMVFSGIVGSSEDLSDEDPARGGAPHRAAG